MTRSEINSLEPGDYVQEILGSAHGGRFIRWGRPRKVTAIDHRWVTAKGKACVHFAVAFAGNPRTCEMLYFHWTAVEGQRTYKLVFPRPSEADLAHWEATAEGSPLTFDALA